MKALSLLLLLFGASNVLDCEVTSLDTYGFEQVGVYEEFVCVNPADPADFVIIEGSGYISEGDSLLVGLDAENDVTSIIKK